MLDKIIATKKEEIKNLEKKLDMSAVSPKERPDLSSFLDKKDGKIKVIAEIKKASPVKGVLAEDLDPIELASVYEKNGAAAVSVITEEKYFLGSRSLLPQVKETVKIPVLRKDFIIDEVQLYETFFLGADLVLLIAAVLDYSNLLALCEKSIDLGLEPFLEIHDEDEALLIYDLPVRIVGVNNRNLRDFSVDIKNSLALSELIPSSYFKASASGIKSPEELALLETYGYNAALIGESLVRSGSPGDKLKALLAYR
ncbi:indole-3-glycerol phosphate synthase TrpC [Thermosyntropha sp.]|uniref:indole-3-glycerol phosphate synthase TrpC n=1 Tax=Thermosyntropha sp. TaxID=2740820 RepID=UPI0025E1929F|nr:indole-3-glycerol phosphate synthase TrpC [Thermosyntropha sp.]MBO8158769.1 indole-3-glycerol phosphate synthase TrpC [Thermosyntropha sp.]